VKQLDNANIEVSRKRQRSFDKIANRTVTENYNQLPLIISRRYVQLEPGNNVKCITDA